jgi:hypothetical protein
LASSEAAFAFSSDDIHDSAFILSGTLSAERVAESVWWDLKAFSLPNELGGNMVDLSTWLSSFDSKKSGRDVGGVAIFGNKCRY